MHNCLARQLRAMGHDAIVASNGSRWMDTGRDIDLTRKGGAWGTVNYLCDIVRNLPKMTGFDIVEISNPIFLDLRPSKVRPILDYLRRHNRRVILSALGVDRWYYDACHDRHTFRYSDYMVGDRPSPFTQSEEYLAQRQHNWGKDYMLRHHDYVIRRVDGVVACLWEYYAAYQPRLPEGIPLAYAGIPVELDALTFRPIEAEPARVRMVIGIQRDRTAVKGTDRLLEAARRMVDRHPDRCTLDVVENVPYAEYVERIARAHVLLDQIYSYTPATNALIAMAQGLVAVSGGEPEYYDFIGERDNRPVINVDPTVEGDIDAKLERLIAEKDRLPALSRASRAFVEKHNAAPIVAQRYLDFWHSAKN